MNPEIIREALGRRVPRPFARRLAASWEKDGKALFLTALAATALFSFAAHGFLFSNEFFSHDSMDFTSLGPHFYTTVGRFVISFYEGVRGELSMPWVIGLLFILWTALAACWITSLLGIRSRTGIILTCGLLCTNVSLSLTGATYIYCMDEYALALALAAAAAWLLCRDRWYVAAWGLLPLALSLGIYQPYFTVAASLCLMALVRETVQGPALSGEAPSGEGGTEAAAVPEGGETQALNGTAEGVPEQAFPEGKAARKALAPWAGILWKGVRRVGLLAAGFGVYYLLWSLSCGYYGVTRGRMDESILSGEALDLPVLLQNTFNNYVDVLREFSAVWGPALPLIHRILLALILVRLVLLLLDRTLPLANRIILPLLMALLPFAFNSAYLLLSTGFNDLTAFARELLYLLPLPAMEPRARKRWWPWVRGALVVLLGVAVWQHIVFANEAYLKKELEKTDTLFLAARIVDRIENAEEYVPGVTKVAIAGFLYNNPPMNEPRDVFRGISPRTGLQFSHAATYNLEKYLLDYLHYPIPLDTETDVAAWPEVRAMPIYPAEGCVKLVRGILVLKLSWD